MTVIRTIARPMIAATFFVGAADALKNAPQLAGKASGVIDTLVPLVKRVAPSAPIPEDPVTVVRLNAVIQLAAAGALATGKTPGWPRRPSRPRWCRPPSPDTGSGRSRTPTPRRHSCCTS